MSPETIIALVYCGIAGVSAFIIFFCAAALKKITTKYSDSRLIFLAFIFAGVAAIFDCAYILRENKVTNFPNWLNYVLILIYIASILLTGGFWVIYSEKRQNSWFVRNKKRLFLYCLPLIIFSLMALTTPLHKLYFFFDETGDYKRGPLFIVLSSITMVYVLQTGIAAFIRSFKKENYVHRNDYRRLFGFAAAYSLIQIIQLVLEPVFPYRSCGTMLFYLVFLIQNMKEMIGKDALTHTNNRYQAEHYLDDLMSNHENFEIGFLDADKFKLINDKYGHQQGDKALQYLVKALEDSLDKKCFIARMGGDEFIIVNVDLDNSIKEVENKINKKLQKILEDNKTEFRFTVSVGYAYKDDSITSIPDIIQLADSKLYERKAVKSSAK